MYFAQMDCVLGIYTALLKKKKCTNKIPTSTWFCFSFFWRLNMIMFLVFLETQHDYASFFLETQYSFVSSFLEAQILKLPHTGIILFSSRNMTVLFTINFLVWSWNFCSMLLLLNLSVTTYLSSSWLILI